MSLSFLLFLFLLAETTDGNRMFTVYLGNIPADVTLEEVQINGQRLMSQKAERGLGISAIDTNGTRAYEVQLPFEDAAVHWMVRGCHKTLAVMFWFVTSCFFHHTSPVGLFFPNSTWVKV